LKGSHRFASLDAVHPRHDWPDRTIIARSSAEAELAALDALNDSAAGLFA
jgi:hypothetical protein